jgi:hypothetical protein
VQNLKLFRKTKTVSGIWAKEIKGFKRQKQPGMIKLGIKEV